MMVLLMSIALLGGGNSAAHQQQVKNSSRADDDTTAGTAAPPPPSCGRGCQRFVFDDAVESHGARCLDGSPPGFYVRPGQGADKAKFLVYSHGGSWCYDLVSPDTSGTWNCAVRASTYEGSSTHNPPAGPPRANMDKGIMSSDCKLNPHFCNYTVVYFMYCDGSSFTGDREEPHLVDGSKFHGITKVWSRGKRNLQALWDRLLEPSKWNATRTGVDLSHAASVVVTGASAGGFMTFYHCDHIRSLVPSEVPLRCVPDCGFWPDFPSASGQPIWHQAMAKMTDLHNASGGFDQSCVAAHPADSSYCAHPPNALPYIDTPIFISTSHQDQDAISVSALADGRGQGYIHPNVPPAGWPAQDRADLDPCFTADVTKCTGKAGAFFTNWTDTITVLLDPATQSSKHGYFVNRCYRHHNIDGSEAFETTIPVGNHSVNLVASVAAWIATGDGPTTKLIDPRPAALKC